MKISLIGQKFDKKSGQGVYKYSDYLSDGISKSTNVEKIDIGTSRNPLVTLFKNIFLSSKKIIGKKSDVYHFMMPELAFSSFFKKPSIVTIHDVIPLIIKERKGVFNLYFKFAMKMALRANHLIAVSNSTKKDLQRFFHTPDSKISVVYEGVDHSKFYPIKNKAKSKAFTAGYIGGLGKRKNVVFILKLAKLLEKEKINFKIGGVGPEKTNLENFSKKLGLKNIEFVGFVPEEKLNEFYNSLDLLIFPSLYEGFGLPVLEAMATGTPVMASDNSSLKEIVGNSGILIDTDKINLVVDILKKLLKNNNELSSLSKKSLVQSKKFNWEKTAEETLNIYEKIIKNEKDN